MDKTEYQTVLIDSLARDLNMEYGRGFSRSNLKLMRLLFLQFPISQTLSDLLSWSHYVDLVFYHRFMYLTDYRERSLKDVITQLEPGLFKKVTGLDVKDFELLVSLGLYQ